MVRRDQPRAGLEVAVRVLGVDPALDGVAAQVLAVALEGERLARGDADLLLHQVEAGDHLGDRVLDLDARVHLHEVERPVRVEQELDGAGAYVADVAPRARTAASPMRARSSTVSAGLGLSSMSFWWRRCTEQSRSPRCTTLPCCVAQHLDLDVPRVLEVLLHVHRPVAEGGQRLVLRQREQLRELLAVPRDAHALPAAARRRLDDDREADRLGDLAAPRPDRRWCPRSPAPSAPRPPSPAAAPWPCRPSGGSARAVGPMNVMFDAPQISANSAFSARKP